MSREGRRIVGACIVGNVETAPPGRRGVRGSYPSMAAALGLVGGGLLALLLGLLLTPEQLADWGWRLPFLVAAPLGLLGLYVRRRLEDTPVFREVERRGDRPRARWRDTPASTRLTSGSLGFNPGVGAPSGFGPLAAAALVVTTGLSYAPGFLLAGVAVVCGVALYALLPETAGRDLPTERDATTDVPAPA